MKPEKVVETYRAGLWRVDVVNISKGPPPHGRARVEIYFADSTSTPIVLLGASINTCLADLSSILDVIK